MSYPLQMLALWMALANAAGFALMGADKGRARQQRQRFPEKALFLPAVLGGTPGCIAGMYCFRHKTRHWYFRLGLPALLLVQLAAGIWLYQRFR